MSVRGLLAPTSTAQLYSQSLPSGRPAKAFLAKLRARLPSPPTVVAQTCENFLPVRFPAYICRRYSMAGPSFRLTALYLRQNAFEILSAFCLPSVNCRRLQNECQLVPRLTSSNIHGEMDPREKQKWFQTTTKDEIQGCCAGRADLR